jgi:drug/metabolite transporter (DMT)-like permease
MTDHELAALTGPGMAPSRAIRVLSCLAHPTGSDARTPAGTVASLATPALAVAPLAAWWHLLVHPPTASNLLAVAAVVLTSLALAFLAHAARIATAVTARPLTGRASALREKARGAVYQRQIDPDAAGHSRPRAPCAAPAAA